MWNKELYVREQQDAYEFFTSLIDQMDEYLKVEKSVTSPVTPSNSVIREQCGRIGITLKRQIRIWSSFLAQV